MIKNKVRILYEDEEIIVAVKPAGMDSQESRGMSLDMVNALKNHLASNKAKTPYIAPVHRLDRPVKGIMIYAKTKEAASALSAQIAKAGHMDKEYLVVVSGRFEGAGVLENYLRFDRKNNISLICGPQDAGAQSAKLEYEAVECIDGEAVGEEEHRKEWLLFEEELKKLKTEDCLKGEVTLVRIKLFTGRHHQIRLQLLAAGHPVIGDTKYNAEFAAYNKGYALCLCASALSFEHPLAKKKMSFTLMEE